MTLATYPVPAVRRRIPRLRAYDGFLSVGKTGRITFTRATRNGPVETQTVTGAISSGTSLTLGNASWGPSVAVVPVNATILVGIVTLTGVTVTAPAGYTQDATVASGGVTLRVYRKLSSGAEGGTATFTFNTATGAAGVLVAYTGITTSSPLDKTATNTGSVTGTSLSLSTGTTAATAQASEIAIGFWGGSTPGGAVLVSPTTAGYAGFETGGAGTLAMVSAADHALVATGTQTATAALKQAVSAAMVGVAAILTYKIDSAAQRFQPLGEADSWEGQATWKGADVSTFQATIPADDPVAAYLKANVIIEIYLPRHVCADGTVLAGETFGWYYVQHIAEDDSQAIKRVTISGPDLRQKVADRVANYTVLAAARGPSTFTATDWIRRLIDYTCISMTGTPDITTTVPGLVLESVAGTTGTVYADPPFAAGAQLTQAIATLCKKDGIQWRIVVTNPGQSTAALTVQTTLGVSRTIGTTSEAVFSRKWDTAAAVRRIRDASNAVTALTVKGPSSGATQTTITVSDAAAIELWGYIHGYADATNVPYLTTAAANAILAERLPKEFAEVDMSDAQWCQAFRHYRPGDTVSVIDDAGRRFDGPITAFTLYSTGSLQSAESEINLWQPRPPDVNVPVLPPGWIGRRGAVEGGSAGTITVGYDPASQWTDARDSDGGANRQYTHLAGLTKTATEINGVANGATANPRQGAGSTATSGGTPSVTGLSSPGSVGPFTIGSSSTDAEAAKVADVQAAINQIVTLLNSASGLFTSAASVASTSAAASTVNSTAQSVLSAHNSTITQLQSANIVL